MWLGSIGHATISSVVGYIKGSENKGMSCWWVRAYLFVILLCPVQLREQVVEPFLGIGNELIKL